MKTLILGIIAAVLLTSCDTVEDMRDILDVEEQLRGLAKEEIGVTPLVGFNSRGGVLIDVSFAFSANDVADRSVSELVRVAHKAVAKSFTEKPRAIYIQLVTALPEDS